MANYVDGFVFPVLQDHLDEYRVVAEKVAEIWKEYGAISYQEYIGEDFSLAGVRSFPEVLDLKEHEVVVFGFVEFSSKEARDLANKQVPSDSRMAALVTPLVDPSRLIFDARRMVYGGFQKLISSKK